MKPAPFEYYAPASVEEALDRLANLEYGAKVLAGGQSLIPAMNFRMATPTALVDLNTVSELFYIKPAGDGGLLIGAMTRDSEVEFSPEVKEKFPMIVEAMPHIAHLQIRHRGTFGGAIAHADPTAQLPAVVLALNARVKVLNTNGERWVPIDEFFVGPFATVIEPEEILTEIAIPAMKPRSGSSYQQMARQAGAQALVGAASLVTLDEANKCSEARIALLSVGETPVLAQQAAQMLIGETPTPELIEAAAETAGTADIDPGGDIHCTAEFRRHLAKVLTRKSLNQAFDHAMGRGG